MRNNSDIQIHGDFARVPLYGRGPVDAWAIVDLADLHLVDGWRWGQTRKDGKRYALRRDESSGKRQNVHMHRVIIDAPRLVRVDHIDGDPLNNRRANLRMCSHAENMRNTTKKATNTTGFKGVWKHGRGYYASVQKAGKKVRIGPFSTPELAAAAYAGAATVLFGEFARFELP